ncbi:MAG: hypothetical protein R6V26_01955 [Roseovarius sp.]
MNAPAFCSFLFGSMVHGIDTRYLNPEEDDGSMSEKRKELLSRGAIPLSEEGNFCGYLQKKSNDGKFLEIYEPVGEWGQECYSLRNRISL